MAKLFVGIACGLMALKLFCMVVYVHLPFFHAAVYYILSVFMLVSYAGTVFIQPSFPVSVFADNEHEAQENDSIGDARYCEKCDRVKPAEYHHCSVCGVCISHMDHHCPWTGNCVGLRTKKLFVLFLLYTSLACLWFAYSVMYVAVNESSLVWFTGILATCIGFLLFGYFCFHIYLLVHGRTTLDFLAHRRGNDYGFLFNMQVYFGRNWWAYWLPIVPACMWKASSSSAAISSDE